MLGPAAEQLGVDDGSTGSAGGVGGVPGFGLLYLLLDGSEDSRQMSSGVFCTFL